MTDVTPGHRLRLPRWQPGRQGSGYHKLRLLRTRCCDLWLIRFPPGSWVPPHRDHVARGRHVRVNLVLVKAREGGEFRCRGAWIDRPRLKVFRSDVHAHEVSTVTRGERWVLSLGLLLPP